MAAVEVSHLSYSYGKAEALHDLDLVVPEGAVYALLGPNGAGKTTLLQILIGLRRAREGRVSSLGVDSRVLRVEHRTRIAYVAEGRPLPGWMTLEYLEAYLAPLYPTWDGALAGELRARFGLDPRRRIGTLSRGEHMKAALLCALAPRPKLLLMDEPFTGIDVVVKDELVRGLLATAGAEGCTVLIASHDIGELELLADWVGFLDRGRLRVSEPIERLRERFRRVTVVADEASLGEPAWDSGWLAMERAGRRLTFVVPDAGRGFGPATLRARLPGADHIDVEEMSLREIYVALARPTSSQRGGEATAA